MGFENLIHGLNGDTLKSLRLFEPELALCVTIVVILLLRMIGLTQPGQLAAAGARGLGRCAGPGDHALGHCRRSADPARGAVHRHAGVRRVYRLLPRGAVVVRRAVRDLHLVVGHSRPGCRTRRFSAGARRHAGHVPDGLGESSADRVPGRGDGQRAVVRTGRPAQRTEAEQRGGPEICGLWRRHGRGDAVRSELAGRRAGILPHSYHGPAAVRPAGQRDRSQRGRGQAVGFDAGGADGDGRRGVQAVGRAVPLLVPGRVRGGFGRSQRLPFGSLEGGRLGAASASHDRLLRFAGASRPGIEPRMRRIPRPCIPWETSWPSPTKL